MATNDATAPKLPDARTLREAHEVLGRLRPKQNASLQTWLTFRQTSAALYTHIADVDRFHHHEALYWAQREQETAKELTAQIHAGNTTNSTGRTQRGRDGDEIRP